MQRGGGLIRPQLPLGMVSLALCAGAARPDRARILITDIQVDSPRVARGGAFDLRVRAEKHGVNVLNFRVRTPYRAGRGDVPDGSVVEKRTGHAVLPDHPSGNIMDNGTVDKDERDGRLAVRISTRGLAPGTHFLVVFAHNRPGDGAHVLAYRNLQIDVDDTQARIRVLPQNAAGVQEPVEFEIPHAGLEPGGTFVCGLRSRHATAGALTARLRSPYTWSEDEVLPGFDYDSKAKVGYVQDGPDHLIHDNGPNDHDPRPGAIRVRVPTAQWPPGVHVLTLELAGNTTRAPHGGTARAYRDFSIKVPGPGDQLDVRVEPSVYLGPGTHFSNLVHLGNGQVLADAFRSEDGGQTWHAVDTVMPRPNLLPSGDIVATAYKAFPTGRKGEFRGQLFRSADGGRTVDGPTETRVMVPLARAALGHSRHVGPLFGRSIVELDNGHLISSMYGWFDGDSEPDRYRKGGTMRRSYICRSPDRGRTWEYLSSVAYRPFLGNEGYSELVIRRLPNGEILALVRTGGNSNPGWQDNPLMVSRSSDDGQTWTPIRRTGVEGVWPDLCVMSDGTLVCSTGRPGAFVMFSTDNGNTWTDHTPVDAERYSGYTAVCEIAPGELLVGYGVRHGLDPDTGQRRDALRVARVTVRRRP